MVTGASELGQGSQRQVAIFIFGKNNRSYWLVEFLALADNLADGGHVGFMCRVYEVERAFSAVSVQVGGLHGTLVQLVVVGARSVE